MNKPSPDSFLFCLSLSPFPLLPSFFLPVFPLALEPFLPARNKPCLAGIFLEPPQYIWLEWMPILARSWGSGSHSSGRNKAK